jgi:hypothetical protein
LKNWLNLLFKICCVQGITLLLLTGCQSTSFEYTPASSAPPPAGSEFSIFNLRGAVGGSRDFSAHESWILRGNINSFTFGPVTNDQGVTITPGGDEDLLGVRLPISPVEICCAAFGKSNRIDALGGTFDIFVIDGIEEIHKLTLLNTDFGGSGLNYTTYGLWEKTLLDASGLTASQQTAAFSFGFPTSVTAMPTTGLATYTGRMDGRYSASLAENQVINGSFQLTSNFGTSTMTGAFTNVTLDGTPFRDINASTSIANNTFAGTVTTAAAAPGQTGPDMSGAIQGGFYGPSAQEVSGVFQMSGGGAVMTAGFAGAK